MSRLEKSNLPGSSEISRDWNPITNWLASRRQKSESAKLEVQRKREGYIATIKSAIDELSERDIGTPRINFSGEQHFAGRFEVESLGALETSQRFPPYYRAETANKVSVVQVNPVTRTSDISYIGIRSDDDGNLEVIEETTYRTGSKYHQPIDIQTSDLETLGKTAEGIKVFADAAKTCVDIVNAIDEETTKTRRSYGKMDTGVYKPAVYEGRVDEENFTVSYGWIKTDRSGKHGSMETDVIKVIQKGNTAYVITEAEDDYYQEFSRRGKRMFGHVLRSLKKVELTELEYDPQNPESSRSQDITSEDVEFLTKVANAIPSAEPRYWYRVYSGPEQQYKKWKTEAEIIAEEDFNKRRVDKERKEREEYDKWREDFWRKKATQSTAGEPTAEAVKIDHDRSVLEAPWTLEERNNLITQVWKEIRQDWKVDAENIVSLVQSGSGVVVEAPNKTGKSTLLMPEVVEVLKRQGHIVSLTLGLELLGSKDAERSILSSFFHDPSFSDERGRFERKPRFERSEKEKETTLIKELLEANKGKAVLLIDEAGSVFEDGIEAGKTHLQIWFSKFKEMGIIPILINAGTSRKARGGYSSVFKTTAGEQGLNITAYEMTCQHVRQELVKKFMEAYGVSSDLIDFVCREENKAFCTPGLLGRLVAHMGTLTPESIRIYDLGSLRRHFKTNREHYIGRNAIFGGSKEDMVRAIRNLEDRPESIISKWDEESVPFYN